MSRIKKFHLFKHKSRICIVMEMGWQENLSRTFLEGSIGLSDYCNGYVEVAPKNKGKGYDNFISRIKTDELTFSGNFELLSDVEKFNIDKNIWFFGFDSGHAWNDNQPESKTFKSVKKRTIKLCKEMIKKGI